MSLVAAAACDERPTQGRQQIHNFLQATFTALQWRTSTHGRWSCGDGQWGRQGCKLKIANTYHSPSHPHTFVFRPSKVLASMDVRPARSDLVPLQDGTKCFRPPKLSREPEVQLFASLFGRLTGRCLLLAPLFKSTMQLTSILNQHGSIRVNPTRIIFPQVDPLPG
jgi:hypothetical protein